MKNCSHLERRPRVFCWNLPIVDDFLAAQHQWHNMAMWASHCELLLRRSSSSSSSSSTIWHNMAMWALVEEKRLKHFTPHYWVGDTPWDIRWADRRIFIITSTTAYMPPVVIYVVICGDICATCGDGGGGPPTLVGRETCAKEIFLPSDGSHVWSCDC